MVLLHLPLDGGGIIWGWIWNTDEMCLKKKERQEGGEINFRGEGLAHLMNSCSLRLPLSSLTSFSVRMRKMKRRSLTQ